MNWDAFWSAWAALATSGLVVVTAVLVVWAARTFGHEKEVEAKKRQPLVALWVAAPSSPDTYVPYAREGQFGTYLSWWRAISASEVGGLIQQRSVVTCWAYNIGQGPALRIRVPYRLDVFEIARVGSPAPTGSVNGEFEIVHVPSNSWGGAKTYLDVTYYPKYRIELLLDGVTVVGVDRANVEGALAPTCEPVLEGDNHWFWEFLRQRASQPPEPPPPAPILDALPGTEDKGGR